MAAFLKSLARLLGPSKSEPQVHLAAFGKHPGWNDHIDDLGLDTDELVTAKKLLYLQGINQNIDAAAWEKLEPDQRIDSFLHDFLWHMPRGSGAPPLIAGRLWASVDGKGRDKYPMVLCVEIVDLPDSFAVTTALPSLAKTHERCASASTASTVRQIMDTDRETLRASLKNAPAPMPLRPATVAQVANHPDMHASREGFHRIIYQIIRGMGMYRPGAAASGTRRPEQIRVPTCGLSTPDALLFWLRIMLSLLDPAHPILLLAPDPKLTDLPGDQNGWIDIIVGEPAASNLFCMKAKNKTLPVTSDIPYTLDPVFTAALDKFIESCTALPDPAPLPPWPNL